MKSNLITLYFGSWGDISGKQKQEKREKYTKENNCRKSKRN